MRISMMKILEKLQAIFFPDSVEELLERERRKMEKLKREAQLMSFLYEEAADWWLSQEAYAERRLLTLKMGQKYDLR